ncbi:MAG: hypothetical protein WCO09_03005 [bacterium]
MRNNNKSRLVSKFISIIVLVLVIISGVALKKTSALTQNNTVYKQSYNKYNYYGDGDGTVSAKNKLVRIDEDNYTVSSLIENGYLDTSHSKFKNGDNENKKTSVVGNANITNISNKIENDKKVLYFQYNSTHNATELYITMTEQQLGDKCSYIDSVSLVGAPSDLLLFGGDGGCTLKMSNKKNFNLPIASNLKFKVVFKDKEVVKLRFYINSEYSFYHTVSSSGHGTTDNLYSYVDLDINNAKYDNYNACMDYSKTDPNFDQNSLLFLTKYGYSDRYNWGDHYYSYGSAGINSFKLQNKLPITSGDDQFDVLTLQKVKSIGCGLEQPQYIPIKVDVVGLYPIGHNANMYYGYKNTTYYFIYSMATDDKDIVNSRKDFISKISGAVPVGNFVINKMNVSTTTPPTVVTPPVVVTAPTSTPATPTTPSTPPTTTTTASTSRTIYVLKTAVVGSGKVAVSRSKYWAGETAKLKATASRGWTFTGWSGGGATGGACTGTSPLCSIVMDENKTITANFVKIVSTPATTTPVTSTPTSTTPVTSVPAPVTPAPSISQDSVGATQTDGYNYNVSLSPDGGIRNFAMKGQNYREFLVSINTNNPKAKTASLDISTSTGFKLQSCVYSDHQNTSAPTLWGCNKGQKIKLVQTAAFFGGIFDSIGPSTYVTVTIKFFDASGVVLSEKSLKIDSTTPIKAEIKIKRLDATRNEYKPAPGNYSVGDTLNITVSQISRAYGALSFKYNYSYGVADSNGIETEMGKSKLSKAESDAIGYNNNTGKIPNVSAGLYRVYAKLSDYPFAPVAYSDYFMIGIPASANATKVNPLASVWHAIMSLFGSK